MAVTSDTITVTAVGSTGSIKVTVPAKDGYILVGILTMHSANGNILPFKNLNNDTIYYKVLSAGSDNITVNYLYRLVSGYS